MIAILQSAGAVANVGRYGGFGEIVLKIAAALCPGLRAISSVASTVSVGAGAPVGVAGPNSRPHGALLDRSPFEFTQDDSILAIRLICHHSGVAELLLLLPGELPLGLTRI